MDLSTPDNLRIVDHLLTTTRSVRKRLDLARPVQPAVIEECLNIAIQAPTGSNRQGWHFLVIADAGMKAQIAHYYRQSWNAYAAQRAQTSQPSPSAQADPDQARRVGDSAQYLADHLHEVPIHVIPCIEGRTDGASAATQAALFGSILPAAWSLMLALRARGLGSAWTTLHLAYEKEVAQILGIPDHVTQAALLPVAYFKGEDFRPAGRLPIAERTYWDRWGNRG